MNPDDSEKRINDLEERIKYLERMWTNHWELTNDKDLLFDEAMAIINELQTITSSTLQQKLKIGYMRTSQLLTQLEDEGYVKKEDNNKWTVVRNKNLPGSG